MNILIDTLCCGNQIYGVSRVLLEQLERLTSPANRDLKIFLVVSRDNRDIFDVPGATQVLFPFSLRMRGLSLPVQLLWERLVLPRLVRKLGIDVFLRPNLAWHQPLPCPQAVVINDLAEFHPYGSLQYSRLRGLYRRLAVSGNMKRATRVITISEHAAGEIRTRFPETAVRVTVVHCGPPQETRRAVVRADAQEGCFLSVGKLLRHKNHMVLCRAYVRQDKLSPLKHPLVFLGGDGNASEELKAYVEREGYGHRILFPGFVTDAEKTAYYRNALAFLFPTFYEGFGLPLLESMAQGLPVVSSNAACLPEVAGGGALLLDPRKEEDWAKAIGDIDAGRIDLEAMAEAGYANARRFSWETSANGIATVLAQLAGRPRGGRRGMAGAREDETAAAKEA